MAKVSGKFAASRARAIALLDDLGLVSDVNDFPDYSEIVVSDVRHKPYTEVWRSFLQRGLYDVRLADESLIQFSCGQGDSFSFYDAPVKAMTFEEFATEQLGAAWDDEVFADLIAEMHEDYEVYLASLDYERPATPVRYDYSPNQYRCACHPVAHVHFGFSSDVRIAARRRWDPEAFAMFVVRQFFPKHWDRLVDRVGVKLIAGALRLNLDEIAGEYWGDRHEAEVYFT